MKIIKLISGGQVGADSGGLMAAHDVGIKTGGTAPKSFRTKYGKNIKLKTLGLIEHESWEYGPRTIENVKNSDGTIRFAYDFMSPGELCTLKAIKKHKKPYFDFDLNEFGNYLVFDFLEWVDENKIAVLNVAGNAGSTKEESFKIFNLVRKLLKNWIERCNQ